MQIVNGYHARHNNEQKKIALSKLKNTKQNENVDNNRTATTTDALRQF